MHDLVDGLIALMNSNESRPRRQHRQQRRVHYRGVFRTSREIVEKVQQDDGVTPF